MSSRAIRIGDRVIGGGARPMIIAELSGNHNGSIERAMALVRAAAEHGADAIKLQTYTADSLTIDSNRPEFFIDDPGGVWHGRRLWELYDEAHTPLAWHAPLFEEARSLGLACISSAYDVPAVETLVALGVDAIKIASFELVHHPLLRAAARSGKPLFISTGMGTLKEIDAAVGVAQAGGCEELALLRCTSTYPASEADAHLCTMVDMRVRHNVLTGLSDHTIGPHVAYAATALGASVIEKHFTLSRNDGGVDSSFSMEPQELRALRDGSERVWRSLGVVRYGPLPGESASMSERPSIFVVQSVQRGEVFSAANVRVIRPATGLPPACYDDVIGRVSAADIPAGVPLQWDVIAPETP